MGPDVTVSIVGVLVGVSAIIYAVRAARRTDSALTLFENRVDRDFASVQSAFAKTGATLTQTGATLATTQTAMAKMETVMSEIEQSLTDTSWTTKACYWKFDIVHSTATVIRSICDLATRRSFIEVKSPFKVTEPGKNVLIELGVFPLTNQVYERKPDTSPEDFLIQLLSSTAFRDNLIACNAKRKGQEGKLQLGEVLGAAYVYAKEKQKPQQTQ